MAFIGSLAVGLGAMRLGSWLANRSTLAVTLVVLLSGLLGAIVRRGEGPWAGFALFGWAYLMLAFLAPLDGNYGARLNPASDLIDELVAGLHPFPGPEPGWPAFNAQFEDRAGGMS